MTSGCPLGDEEGNVVSVREAHALDCEAPNKRFPARGHVLRSAQRPVHVVVARSRVTRSIRYRCRANLREQEEPASGPGRTDVARLTACRRLARHLSRKRRGRVKVVRDA